MAKYSQMTAAKRNRTKCVCVCMCVCVSERERERGRLFHLNFKMQLENPLETCENTAWQNLPNL